MGKPKLSFTSRQGCEWQQMVSEGGAYIIPPPAGADRRLRMEERIGRMQIQKAIAQLVCYGLASGLIENTDSIYTANRLLELLHLDALETAAECEIMEFEAAGGEAAAKSGILGKLETILSSICDYACEKGLIPEDSVGWRDLFDTKAMAILTDRPGNVARTFFQLCQRSPQEATDWFYRFSCDTDYIRRYRIARDKKWVTATKFGDLDITINLSKPEKDPKDIAAARLAKQTSYPKCLLCRENVGYAGRPGHPARGNHRVIPLELDHASWFFQYSPYVYYNEHCIVFNGEHVPMKIERASFARLLDFVGQFPHYFIGSNADLPIVGGSILSHDHFQGGRYEFAMAKAPIEQELTLPGWEDIRAGIVRWPMSVIRISGADPARLADLADKILQTWRGYTDEEAFLFAETDGEKHNTITPIARRRGSDYELDLVLRNNITTKEHPLGVYHPHAKLHHIKKENIGLIEVMGLAVLPARLKAEMEGLRCALLEGRDIREDEALAVHADWLEELRENYPDISMKRGEEVEAILQKEIGLVFEQVLEDAGVYKCTKEGREAFLRFVQAVQET